MVDRPDEGELTDEGAETSPTIESQVPGHPSISVGLEDIFSRVREYMPPLKGGKDELPDFSEIAPGLGTVSPSVLETIRKRIEAGTEPVGPFGSRILMIQDTFFSSKREEERASVIPPGMEELESLGFEFNPSSPHMMSIPDFGTTRYEFRGKGLIVSFTFFPQSNKYFFAINNTTHEKAAHFHSGSAVPLDQAIVLLKQQMKSRGIE